MWRGPYENVPYVEVSKQNNMFLQVELKIVNIMV